jgi:hypothetical protein
MSEREKFSLQMRKGKEGKEETKQERYTDGRSEGCLRNSGSRERERVKIESEEKGEEILSYKMYYYAAQ